MESNRPQVESSPYQSAHWDTGLSCVRDGHCDASGVAFGPLVKKDVRVVALVTIGLKGVMGEGIPCRDGKRVGGGHEEAHNPHACPC